MDKNCAKCHQNPESPAYAKLNMTCEGISSAKLLADVKRYGCTNGRGPHLYSEMSLEEYEKLMKYRSK